MESHVFIDRALHVALAEEVDIFLWANGEFADSGRDGIAFALLILRVDPAL
jgi:hypothetical protein